MLDRLEMSILVYPEDYFLTICHNSGTINIFQSDLQNLDTIGIRQNFSTVE